MHQLKVQKFLAENGLDSLTKTFAINAKRHGKYPNLVLLKYNQIDSPMAEPIVQECRGLILDESDNWNIVNYGMTKFFNHSEVLAAPIDWSTAKVYTKEDGSLVSLYWYRGEWNFASSGSPDASGNINNSFKWKTFADLMWGTFKDLGYPLPEDTRTCYWFELCTKDNRVVVQHLKPKMVFLGARNLDTLQEFEPEPIAAKYGWECVRSFPLTNFDEITEAAKQLNPMEQEGYVVRDGNFNRVKCKSPQYVAIHHLKDGMSNRRLLEIVRNNENEEFLAHFPEFKEDFDLIKGKYTELVASCEALYETVKDIPVQKDFALKVKDLPWSGAFFLLRSGKVKSFKEAFANCQIQNLESYLKLKAKDLVIQE